MLKILNGRQCKKCGIIKSLEEFYTQGIRNGHQRYYSFCRPCERIKHLMERAKYYAKFPWLKHYDAALNRCRTSSSKYYKKGIQFRMTKEDFKELWFRDKAWLLKIPSIDREKNNLGYIKSNCQFIELSENKGKDSRGENSSSAVLNEKHVLKIRKIYSLGKISQVELGKMYKVTNAAIYRIVKRLTWRHI